MADPRETLLPAVFHSCVSAAVNDNSNVSDKKKRKEGIIGRNTRAVSFQAYRRDFRYTIAITVTFFWLPLFHHSHEPIIKFHVSASIVILPCICRLF